MKCKDCKFYAQISGMCLCEQSAFMLSYVGRNGKCDAYESLPEMIPRKHSAEQYRKVHPFRMMLKHSSLSTHEKQTLIGQAMNGDIEGAYRGYQRLMGVNR